MTKKNLIGKKEIILFILIITISIMIYLLNVFLNKKPSSRVQIIINGELRDTINIEEGKTYDIVQGDYKNTILFTKNGVKVIYSNCQNQLCVHQGEVNYENYKTRMMGNSIICLPHNLAIRLELKDDIPSDDKIDN